MVWAEAEAPVFDECIRLDAARIIDLDGQVQSQFDVKQSFIVEVRFTILKEKWPVNVHIHLKDLAGHYILVGMDNHQVHAGIRPIGQYVERCTVQTPLLNVGDYRFDIELWPGSEMDHRILQMAALSFTITDDSAAEGVRQMLGLAVCFAHFFRGTSSHRQIADCFEQTNAKHLVRSYLTWMRGNDDLIPASTPARAVRTSA
jgi:hypothetical protein